MNNNKRTLIKGFQNNLYSLQRQCGVLYETSKYIDEDYPITEETELMLRELFVRFGLLQGYFVFMFDNYLKEKSQVIKFNADGSEKERFAFTVLLSAAEDGLYRISSLDNANDGLFIINGQAILDVSTTGEPKGTPDEEWLRLPDAYDAFVVNFPQGFYFEKQN